MPELIEPLGPAPKALPLQWVAGNTFSAKLWQQADEDPDDETKTIPANLTGFSFALKVKKHKRAKEAILTADNSYFFLGQSFTALQYDIDEGNPPGTTYDEVHIELPPSLTDITPGCWWWGIEITYPDGKEITPFIDRVTVYDNFD